MKGYLNILKPTGMTSSNVVGRVRYNLKMKKVGHAGTLDPMAVGVLPIMIGKATKMFDYLNLDRKVYVSEFTFGIDTNTIDSEGEIQDRTDVIPVKEEVLQAVSKYFLGKIEQIPPKVSAISINGQRAYDLARKGVEFEINPRSVEIFKFDLIRQSSQKSFIFRVECSKGTYIRSLCRDLAKELNSLAYVSYLSREKSGYFSLEDSITLEHLEEYAQNGKIADYIVDIDAPLGYMDEVHVPIERENTILNGGSIKNAQEDAENIRVYCGGEFVGIGNIAGGYLKISKMFYG